MSEKVANIQRKTLKHLQKAGELWPNTNIQNTTSKPPQHFSVVLPFRGCEVDQTYVGFLRNNLATDVPGI